MPRVRLTRVGTLFAGLIALFLLTAAPAQATHPRPKSASPTLMSLVPAYEPCAAPNRTHGPPLAFPSCNPPAQTSAQATVGTPDAFGGAASATGHVRLKDLFCDFNCDDDMLIEMVLGDVRCVPAGTRCGSPNSTGPADYSGEMRFSFTFRVTDHYNATAPGGGLDPATVEDFATAFSFACAQTASTSTGSNCSLSTTLSTLIPGAVKSNKRTIWALDAVQIADGGADGDGDTTADNTVFARPGVFIP